MTKALLKKQMLEVFSWVYLNKKSGTRRSKNAIVGYVLLYLFLFVLLANVFGTLAQSLCGLFLTAGMGWLYWCLMGMIAVLLGVFGSVFNTYSSLYAAKDNDTLLAMPISASQILLTRLFGVYSLGLMYELIVIIPTIIVWFASASISIVSVINIVLIAVLLSLFILVLSAIVGWVVALIANKVKRKNFIVVVTSLAFLALYYYFFSQSYSFLEDMTQHLDDVGNTMMTAFYPLYHMGMAAEGNIISMLIFAVFILALVGIAYWVLSRSFLKLATANSGKTKKHYKEKTTRPASADGALLKKEFRRFISSSSYMLNCGLGIVLMPLAAVVLIWKADALQDLILTAGIHEYAPLLAVLIICMLATMNDMAAPSISLEGKSLWIAQSLPISGRQVLSAKLKMHLLLTWIPTIPLIFVLEWLIEPNLLCAILIPVSALLFSMMMAEIELSLNLRMPNFNWTNEVVPIKQSTPVAIALFGGWLIVIALTIIYFLVKSVISADVFLILICVAFFAIVGFLHHRLMTKGARAFEAL